MDNGSVLIRALENIPPGGFEPPTHSLGKRSRSNQQQAQASRASS